MTAATLPPNLAKIIQRFQRSSSAKQRYEQLIWYGNQLPPLEDAVKIEANKVPGCVSQVFITASLEDGKVLYQGDSDAQLVKGLVGLLITGLKGLTPEEVISIAPDFIQELGLNVSLTPSRANGFYNIFQVMQKKALGYHLAAASPETTSLE
ncbi:MAG: SufE family protein [Coleofasciculaceae cyanobacterium SM2_1_6]|nr:SufE family protein [Coleofasciculaceae cyanobacterium SM2_1_6]